MTVHSKANSRPLRKLVLTLLATLMMLSAVGVTASDADALPPYGSTTAAVRSQCAWNLGESLSEVATVEDSQANVRYVFSYICWWGEEDGEHATDCQVSSTRWIDVLRWLAGDSFAVQCTYYPPTFNHAPGSGAGAGSSGVIDNVVTTQPTHVLDAAENGVDVVDAIRPGF